MKTVLTQTWRQRLGQAPAAAIRFVALLAFCPWLAQAQTVVVIPGDQAMQAMVLAVQTVQREPALSGLKFQVLPQSLPGESDLKALAGADLVIARHMVGAPAGRMAGTFQALAQRGVKAYGAGSNQGVSDKLRLTEDATLTRYMEAAGAQNLANMIRFVAHRDFGLPVTAEAPKELPQSALWDHRSGRLFERFEDYASAYLSQRTGSARQPWVGLVINRGQASGGSDESVKAVALALEQRGFNVATAFGFPSTVPVERFLVDDAGRARVQAVVAMSMKIGNVPDKIAPVLQRLDVPLVNAITLFRASQKEWEDSPIGLDLSERSWQISGPEFAGIIAPTVVATKERRRDAATGLDYIAEVPVPERVARVADRVAGLVALRVTPPAEKRVAVIYYNSPPGKENIGASYLNVLPRSLWQILQRLETEGYDTRGRPDSETALFDRLREHGGNIGSWAPGALEKLVASGNVVMLPVAEYQKWFDQLPAKLRDPMVKAWGPPEDFKVMVWRNPRGVKHFVFPAQRFGKLLYAPQPARGWGEVKKEYHDVQLPPHHQYLAFYLWLQKSEQTHAMVHVGTHATHEWLSGKEVGFTQADPSEVMVGAVPQVYPYIVDVVGEGLQAKRRGMATLISHMTPPFDQAGLNPDLVALRGLLDDYTVALQKSESAAQATLTDINGRASKMGLLKDLGLSTVKDAEGVEALQHYLEEVGQTQSPMGLHTFGVAPSERLRQATARAVVARQGPLSEAERAQREAAFAQLMQDSARAELDAFVAALAGRYVMPGPGGDPLRNPASLPTGRNFYGFDPARLPTPGVYAQGAELATTLVRDYRKKHGVAPDRLLFNLWSGETMRHEGVMESQILALLGVRPVWDRMGRVVDLELISRAQLGRARVDVTVTPSGLYRDSLPTLMLMLDRAVTLAKDQPEADNVIRTNVALAQKALETRGVAPDLAQRMAAVRLFTQPPGAYGTGLDNVIMAGNTWNNESEVAEVYFRRMGHLFGQGFWGEAPQAAAGGDGASLAVDVFKLALKDVKAVLHSRASNLYGTLDNDDVFQYLGGAALAVRQVNGASPETLLVNLADPVKARTESLDQYMGREMRARYLNPVWIKAMLGEGYAGARAVMQVTDNLWGWQVTVPEAVDSAKWQEMFETYVQDKHQLDIKQKFRDAKNMLAFQAMVDRMLVAVNKGYWKADAATIAALETANLAAIKEAGVACHADNCSSDKITQLARDQDRQAMRDASTGFGLDAPGAARPAPSRQAAAEPRLPAAKPPPSPAPDIVRGQEMRETKKVAHMEQLVWSYALLIGLVVLGGMGFQAWRTRRELRA